LVPGPAAPLRRVGRAACRRSAVASALVRGPRPGCRPRLGGRPVGRSWPSPGVSGALRGIRTPNLLIRSQTPTALGVPLIERSGGGGPQPRWVAVSRLLDSPHYYLRVGVDGDGQLAWSIRSPVPGGVPRRRVQSVPTPGHPPVACGPRGPGGRPRRKAHLGHLSTPSRKPLTLRMSYLYYITATELKGGFTRYFLVLHKEVWIRSTK